MTTTTTSHNHLGGHGRHGRSSSRNSQILHYYRKTTPSSSLLTSICDELISVGLTKDATKLSYIETEDCFNVLLQLLSSSSNNNKDNHHHAKNDKNTTNDNENDNEDDNNNDDNDNDNDLRLLLSPQDELKLKWLLAETFEPQFLRLEQPFLFVHNKKKNHNDDDNNDDNDDGTTTTTNTTTTNTWLLEFGPRLAFTSAFSSNAVNICHSCNIGNYDNDHQNDNTTNDDNNNDDNKKKKKKKIVIPRLELSQRYLFHLSTDHDENNNENENGIVSLSSKAQTIIKSRLHDRMTQEEYKQPLTSFDMTTTIDHTNNNNNDKNDNDEPQQQQQPILPKPVQIIPILQEGRIALERLNNELGLGFDTVDLDYYTNLFQVCLFYIYIFVYWFCVYVERERDPSSPSLYIEISLLYYQIP